MSCFIPEFFHYSLTIAQYLCALLFPVHTDIFKSLYVLFYLPINYFWVLEKFLEFVLYFLIALPAFLYMLLIIVIVFGKFTTEFLVSMLFSLISESNLFLWLLTLFNIIENVNPKFPCIFLLFLDTHWLWFLKSFSSFRIQFFIHFMTFPYSCFFHLDRMTLICHSSPLASWPLTPKETPPYRPWPDVF